jgi:hypothetical protein
METEFTLADELYETKKMITATITYAIDVNKDNVFISEVEDFWGESQEDYDELKRTDEELKNAAVSELAEMIYNSVKYNDLTDMITIEVHEV